MSITSRQKLTATALISCISILALGTAFGWLALHTKKITKDVMAVETKLAALEYERKNAHTIEALIETHKPLTERINQTLVSPDRPIAFLEELTELGKQTDNKITLDYSEQESDAKSIVFRITVEGMQKNTFIYLTLLELLPFAITIENINWQNTSSPESAIRTSDTRMVLTIRVKAKS